MAETNFWDDQVAAQRVIADLNRLKAKVVPIRDFMADLEDLKTMLELVDETEVAEDRDLYASEVVESL